MLVWKYGDVMNIKKIELHEKVLMAGHCLIVTGSALLAFGNLLSLLSAGTLTSTPLDFFSENKSNPARPYNNNNNNNINNKTNYFTN